MRQVTTLGQRHAHETLTGWDQSRVDGEVSWAAGECLHVDSPLLWVQVVCLEGALLSQQLDLINELVASVVASTWVSL